MAPGEALASSEGESGAEPLRGSVTNPPGAGMMSPSVLAGRLGTHSLYSWNRMSPLAGDAYGVCENGKESPGKPHRLLRAQWNGPIESRPISAGCPLWPRSQYKAGWRREPRARRATLPRKHVAAAMFAATPRNRDKNRQRGTSPKQGLVGVKGGKSGDRISFIYSGALSVNVMALSGSHHCSVGQISPEQADKTYRQYDPVP